MTARALWTMLVPQGDSALPEEGDFAIIEPRIPCGADDAASLAVA